MINIYKCQDYQIDDMDLKAQYYKSFLNGDVATAQSIYDSNAQLQGKCVNSDMLNKLLDGVLEMENKYNIDVPSFLSSKLNQYQVNINDLIYTKEYASTRQYYVNNFVLYLGEVYFCYNQPNIGTLPTNTNYWIYLGLKGKQGRASLGVKYKGGWSSENNYTAKDMVVYNDDLYVAINDNQSQTPTFSKDWLKTISMIPKIIYISSTEPSGIAKGDIWIKIL